MVVINTKNMNVEKIILTNISSRKEFICCITASRKVAWEIQIQTQTFS